VGQSILRSVAGEFPIDEPRQPAAAADPQRTRSVHEHFSHHAIGRGIGKNVKLPLDEPIYSAAGPEPEPAVAVLANGKDSVTRQAVLGRVRYKLAVAISRQAVPGTQPEAAAPILANIQDAVAGQTVGGCRAGEFAVAEPAHPAVERADPELSRAVFVQ